MSGNVWTPQVPAAPPTSDDEDELPPGSKSSTFLAFGCSLVLLKKPMACEVSLPSVAMSLMSGSGMAAGGTGLTHALKASAKAWTRNYSRLRDTNNGMFPVRTPRTTDSQSR